MEGERLELWETFTFSSLDSMYPLRSVSYLLQACDLTDKKQTCKKNYYKSIINSIRFWVNIEFIKPFFNQRWTQKCNQPSLIPPHLRKLGYIHNVWLSENSFQHKTAWTSHHKSLLKQSKLSVLCFRLFLFLHNDWHPIYNWRTEEPLFHTRKVLNTAEM